MKNILMAVIDVAVAINRFEVPSANGFARSCFYGYGFDPMKCILENKERFVF